MSTGALLTIISGTPGAGKTALAVATIEEHLRREPNRPVFVMGIPELALPHQPVPPVSEWTELKPHPDDPSIMYPAFTFPDGALVVIDEAQNAFRPRSQGSAVPAHVAAMERHRHKGLDFILITQHPTMLDPNVRRLCGKHLHLRALWAGRRLYEWSEASDPNSKTDRTNAASRRYRLPKRVFGLYKSSSMHVRQSRRLPFAVYILAVALVLGGWYAWQVYDSLVSRVDGARFQAEGVGQVVEKGAGFVPQAVPGAAVRETVSTVVPAASGAAVADYVPRISTRPETAPMYDALRQVRVLPVVAGCVAMGERCTCYTAQATDAYLTPAQCREWLRSPPFNPWQEPAPARAISAAPAVAG